MRQVHMDLPCSVKGKKRKSKKSEKQYRQKFNINKMNPAQPITQTNPTLSDPKRNKGKNFQLKHSQKHINKLSKEI